ncbi:MAG: adenosylcobinamide-GDP ribazoletransferase [Acidimicrobiia bacterium]
MSGLRGAVSFLTRVPIGDDGEDPGSSIPWFPIVGLGVGAVAGLAYWGVSVVTGSTFASAVVAVGVAVATTGAFHEDGLADTFDGLSSIRTRERQLEIMRDSRLGTFGVAALVLVLLARVVLVADLAADVSAVVTLAWLHALSRGVVIGIMPWARAASTEGSGVVHLTDVRRVQAVIVAVAVVGVGWWVVGSRLPMVMVGALVGPLGTWAWAHRRIGGVTGDVLGAWQQLALVGGLALVSA